MKNGMLLGKERVFVKIIYLITVKCYFITLGIYKHKRNKLKTNYARILQKIMRNYKDLSVS